MELTPNLENMGFCLNDTNESDVNDFIRVDKISYKKYIDEFLDFYGGEYNIKLVGDTFYSKRKLTFFKKLLLNDEIVGFLSYDHKDDKINDISIRIIEKAQNKGIGTLFLSNLIKLSNELCKPIFIEAIKTNPVQNLYKRLGFEFYKEEDIYLYFVYNP